VKALIEGIVDIATWVDGILWGPWTMVLIVFVSIFLTIKPGFFQVKNTIKRSHSMMAKVKENLKIDRISFQLGMINCFVEMVACGVKKIGIKPSAFPGRL